MQLATIDAYRTEIMMQPSYVQSVLGTRDDVLPEDVQRNTVFSGSGDSLAAAMVAAHFSSGRAIWMDPSDIVQHPRLAESRRLYLVSVSGDTIANIRAARACPGSFAITAQAGSRLATAAGGRIIPLRFPSARMRTAGSISFVASVIACARLVCGGLAGAAGAVHDVFERARHDADNIDVLGSLHILGGALTYPLAMYGAAKFYEVLGYDARHARTEQFFHMELFCARRGDTVMIFEPPGPLTRKIEDTLGGTGINVVVPGGAAPAGTRLTPDAEHGGTGDVADAPHSVCGMHSAAALSHALYYAFLSQMLTLRMAESRGLDDCHYLSDALILGASNASIY